MRDKLKLTRSLIELLPEQNRITEKEAMRTWWINLRRNGGMRLTDVGYEAMSGDLEIEHFRHEIRDPSKFKQTMLLKLDRKLKFPYYIYFSKKMPHSIRFFGSKEALFIFLSDDLDKFLDNYC